MGSKRSSKNTPAVIRPDPNPPPNSWGNGNIKQIRGRGRVSLTVSQKDCLLGNLVINQNKKINKLEEKLNSNELALANAIAINNSCQTNE